MTEGYESPQELFSRCDQEAKKNKPQGPEQFKEWLIQELTFQPVFLPDQPLDAAATTRNFNLQIATLGTYASRYRTLVRLLENATDSETRWVWLAAWLKQEKICEPRDFLPSETYKKVTRSNKERLKGFIRKDFYYYYLVRAWLPYFQRLMDDLRKLKNTTRNPKRALIKGGYDEQAVASVLGDTERRKPTAAVYEWLAVRKAAGGADARTIEVAYSRVSRTLGSKTRVEERSQNP